MDIEQAKNFITIAKTKNITETSRILYVAQSTVSHRLNSLEKELGCQLVIRQKGIKIAKLTKRGQAFIPIAEKWVEAWQETELFKEGSGIRQLNVGCVDSLAICLLSDFFASFSDRHPNIQLQIMITNSDTAYKKLELNEIDIGITCINHSNRDVSIQPILSEEMCCIHSIKEFEKRKKITPAEIQHQSEIMFNCGSEFALWYEFWFKTKSFPKIQVNSVRLVEDYLRRNGYWSIVPESVANDFVQRGVCKKASIENAPPNRSAFLITRSVLEPDQRDIISQFTNEVIEYVEKRQFKNQHK